MARSLTRSRRSARLAVVAPTIALFAVACGGLDTVPFDDEGGIDGSPVDTSTGDAIDTGAPDRSQPDSPMETSGNDVSVSDAARLGDALSDSPDALGIPDVLGALDARDAGDARVALDASMDSSLDVRVDVSLDASDAADAPDASLDAGPSRDPRLLSTARFAVFAGSTVTNAFGTLTTITGDLGTYPDTTAIGPTPPVLVGGTFQLGNLVAQAAAGDVVTLYNGLTPASMPGCTDLTGQDLGGKTLAPGIYCFSTSAQLTGALVLDAGNNPNAEWFFQIGSTLTTGALGAVPASVSVINGGNRCNAFWQVGSSATLGTGTVFSGNIVAMASITLVTGTTVVGRALAETGGVTMDTNTVSIATCP